jgi:futalosine hydrolase
MKILLIAATSDEIIQELFPNAEILISGVGMVNTTYGLTKDLSVNSYDLVINMGVAGCFNPTVKIGDVVEVVEDCFSEIGFENGVKFEEFSNFEITNTFKVEGKTNLQKVKGITVNTVHGNEDSIARIISRLNPDVESMEGAAIFKICKEFTVPCMQIRAISNKVQKRNRENWNMPLAIQNLNTTVQQIIVAL